MSPLALHLDQMRLTVSAAAVASGAIDVPGAGGEAETIVEALAPASGEDYVVVTIGSDVDTSASDSTNPNSKRNQNRRKTNQLTNIDFLSGEAEGVASLFNMQENGTGAVHWLQQPDGYYRPNPGTAFIRRDVNLMEATGWTLFGGATLTEGAGALGPDGNATTRIGSDGSAGNKQVYHGNTGPIYHPTAGEVTRWHWIVFYIKYVDLQWVQVVGANSDHTLNVWGNFDLQNGVTGNSGSDVVKMEIEEVTEGSQTGWYRCAILAPQDGGTAVGAGLLSHLSADTAARSPTYTGTGSYDVWRYYSYPLGCKNVAGDREGECVPAAVWNDKPQRPAPLWYENGVPQGIMSVPDIGGTGYGQIGDYTGGFTVENGSWTGNAGSATNCFDTVVAGVSTINDWKFHRYQCSAAGGTGRVGFRTSVGSANEFYTRIVSAFFQYVPGTTNPWLYCEVSDETNGAGPWRAWFNIQTGAVGTTSTGVKCYVEMCANDCCRVYVTFPRIGRDTGLGSSDLRTGFYCADADNDTDVTLDGSAQMLTMFHQWLAGSWNQSNPYSLARFPATLCYGGFDRVAISISGLGPYTGASFAMRWRDMAFFPTTGHAPFRSFGDTDAIAVGKITFENAWECTATGGFDLDATLVNYVTDGGQQAIGGRIHADDGAFYVDATQIDTDTDTGGLEPTVHTFWFGSGSHASATASMFMVIEEIVISEKKINNTQLADLTTVV